MMHYGHANALRQAKALGDELVVGVVSDEEILLNKGPPVVSLEDRVRMVREVKWVDEVVVGTPYCITPDFLHRLFTRHGVDFIIHGDDPCLLPDGSDAYAEAKQAGRYLEVKRTEGISSTDIVGRMLLCVGSRAAATEAQQQQSLEREFVHTGSPAERCHRSGSPAERCHRSRSPPERCHRSGSPAERCHRSGSPVERCNPSGSPAERCNRSGSPSLPSRPASPLPPPAISSSSAPPVPYSPLRPSLLPPSSSSPALACSPPPPSSAPRSLPLDTEPGSPPSSAPADPPSPSALPPPPRPTPPTHLCPYSRTPLRH
ncbi:hypothetical protein CLOP_g11712 [Closterium sp. NIES-67]|nr:hypothetical protein CLOP_g11712 [Closterium sp. NIES-67]